VSNIDAAAKRAARGAARDQRRIRREQRHRQWRCFWTRPFGHAYIRAEHLDEGMHAMEECISCDKPRSYNHAPRGTHG